MAFVSAERGRGGGGVAIAKRQRRHSLKIWQRDGWKESVPTKANQFGRDNKTQCLAETEDVIRANGPPNTPQVHRAAGSVIVGSII